MHIDISAGQRVPRMLRPLLRRDYRLLFITLLCALTTDGMWLVSVVWQVIDMGGSATSVSMVSGAASVGLLVSTLAGGVLADRVSQQRILFVLELLKVVVIGGVGALAVTGVITVPMLMVGSLALGLVSGFYFPAYSALVPRLVPPSELLAVNGYESAVRPAAAMAVGPAVAAWIIAVASPGAALIVAGGICLFAAVWVVRIRVPQAEAAEGADEPGSPLRELWEGIQYVRRTPWLLATLLFASLMVLVTVGPIDVLLPFAIKDQAQGAAGEHSMILAAYGFGGVAGALFMAARRMPRRYLTVMMVLWGLASLPMVVFGIADSVWPMVIAGFVLGVLFEAPVVIWGTLLQRRVPRRLLGRVSSLDFFVSLVFMPLSFALAGPVSQAIGLTATFVLAGLIPVPLAVIAILAARMPQDELEHPLVDEDEDPDEAPEEEPGDAPVTPTVNAPAPDGTVG
ncbi:MULTISPECIES: MFS transporter [Tsukamurella]|uniref:MFS transporter n=1 Tax=Tsukamurella TaxID=2060 RepID=UPI00208029ED|nr:MFS transporter [Tsukamurella sp. TY48]GIZ96955.1 tetracycline efflux MFS transporter Tet(V) [Tsukamurella sp. TY48]